MSKEYLEAFERLYKCNDDDYTLGYQQHDYKLLQQALQRLEAIDNAKPSEALEELENFELDLDHTLDGTIDRRFINGKSYEEILDIIKQSLLKAQEQEKVLEIIKEYVMPLVSIDDECIWDNEGYSYRVPKKEELELLKRWLG